jgi:conjugal transfer pilus assembly protein TraE
MNKDEMILESNKVLKQRNLSLMVCGVLMTTNLFLSAKVFSSNSEVVLVPNSLEKESSVTNGKASASYLEAITRDVVNLMLNVTPSNTEYTSKTILKITHPAFHGQLKKELVSRNKDVIQRRVSTFFSPNSMTITENFDGAVIVGQLSTYLGKEEVLTESKTYVVSYSFDGFRPLVADFHEVTQEEKSEGGTK